MNKKFSTLMACAFMASAFSLGAQTHALTAQGEIPYRTQAVLSEQFDACLTGVKAINPDYYYQLQVNANGSVVTEGQNDLDPAKVLVQVRDYATGNLTLKVMDIEKAPLTGSLWRIEVKDKGLRGKEYVFVNRETGYTINYDCLDAVTLTTVNQSVADEDATIIKDDNNRWEWYSDDVQPAIFGPKKVWSYTHEGNVVMGLMTNTDNDVVAVKINKDLLIDEMANINFLTLTVRTAGAKVLTADDINTMIDAEGSWQNRDSKNEALFNAMGLMGTPAAIANEDLVTGAYQAKEVADVYPTYATWAEVQPNGNFYGYNILLNKKTTNKYLMVATDETHESIQNPGLHGGLKVKDTPLARVNAEEACDALLARYIWKATYYATNDSLVLEPLNASVITTELKQQGKTWSQSKLASATAAEYYNTINAGSTTGNNEDLNGEFAKKKVNVPVALTAMNATTGIDNRTVITVGQPQNATTMGHLVVTSAGNAIVAAENHANQPFCYPYANMNVKVNFNNTYLPILNRTTQATGIYYLQLSTTKTNSSLDEKRLNGSYLVADYAGHYRYDVWEAEQNFAHMPATQWVVEQLGCPEGGNRWVKITNREFASQAFMGQLYTAGKNAEGKELVYIINHNYQGLRGHNNVATPATNNALNCADTLIFAAVENPTIGYLNIADDVLRENKYAFNLIEKDFSNQFLSANDVIENLRLSTTATNFEFFRVAAPAFGYKVGGGTIGEKYLYKVKVSDANKIDNDHVWVAYDNNHKFVIASEKDINAGKDGLKWATFAFKENSENGGVDCFTLVHHELVPVEGDSKVTAYQPVGVLSKELQTAHTKAIDLCQREYDVFDIIPDARPLYMNMRGDAVVGDKYASYINNEENCMKFTHMKTAGNLFERSLLAEGLLNYLDIETLSDADSRKNAALYVDEVAAAVDSRMPQYMFVIRPDSAVDYTWCSQHGINSTCEHSNPYKGYVAGEFLVNLNDSIHASINKLTDASKFHSDNYTRLAFVEAIHQGDFLYVLKAPYTIASISAADPATEQMYVVPTYLAADQEGIVYDKITLDGSHNNVAFAIRYVGDSEEDGIMLESYDVAMAEADKSEAGIGSFTGAWVTLNGTGVPVLGKFHNENGNHDTDDTVGGGNSTPVKDFSQVINQAAVFSLNATEGPATDTEDVEVGTIKVISGNGSVTVIGAQGKTVAISNILGQTIANTVITSNEATISAPAGVVFVAVEGEAAVKAIVK